MEKFYKKVVLVFTIILLWQSKAEAACPYVTANFQISQTHTCGIPRVFTLTNTSTGLDYNISKYYWYINGVLTDSSVGLANLVRTIYAPGIYKFKLMAMSPNHSCKDSIIISDTVKTKKPGVYDGSSLATWTPQFTNCIQSAGSVVTFNMQFDVEDTMYNFRIIWGDTSADSVGTKLPPGVAIKHNYNTLGHFNFKIVLDSGGCVDTLVGLVVNERIPSASLTPPAAGGNYGCVPFTVRFVNNSFNSSATTKFIWEWGDDEVDTLPASTYHDTIYHTYQKGAFAGASNCDKTIKLTAKNSCGQSVTTWQTVSVYDVDKAKITVADTIMCIQRQGKTFTFTNASELNCRPGPRKYYWDFGDGTNSGWIGLKTAQTHTYPGPGEFQVFLIDSSDCGTDTFFLKTYVTTLPTAGITYSNRSGCKPLTITFTDTVTVNLLLRTRDWDFGDASGGQPQHDTNKTVTHTFYNAGVFTVRCTAKNPCDTVSAWVIVEVFEAPDAKIRPLGNACAPATLGNFNNSTGASSFAHYFWDFGNSITSTLKNPDSVVFGPGMHTIKLKIVDTCGVDSDSYTFVAYTPIIPEFVTDTVCLGDSTHFNANGTHYLDTTFNDAMIWFYFRDTVTTNIIAQGTSPNFAMVFSAPGTYYIRFTVVTNGGCNYNITKPVFVRDRPTVSYATSPYPNVCDGSLITFDGTASAAASTITGYKWDFGDGSFAYSEDTVHQYAIPGNYVVKLTVYNDAGCDATFSNVVRVKPNPKAKIKATSICYGQVTALLDSSYTLGGDTITQWAWDFTGNGTYDAFTKNTTYSYPSSGTYTVILRVTTNRGCLAYDTTQLLIDTIPVPSFTVDSNSKCMFQPFVFTNTTTGATFYTWKWGDNSTNTSVIGNATQQHAYSNSGTYKITVYAYNSNGCMDSTSRTVTVKPKPIAMFAVNDTAVCTPYTFHFTNQALNTNIYKWYINNTLISTDTFLRDTMVNLAGATLQVRLIAGNTNLCLSDTYNITLRTYPNPTANFTAFSLDSCNPFTVHFNNASVGATFYEWYFNDGSALNSSTSPVHTFFNNSTKDSVFNVKLISFNAAGCSDFKILPVHVRPRPTANFSQSRTDSCGPLTVNFTNLSSPGDTETIYTMHFLWNFGNGVITTKRDTTVRFVAAQNNDTTYNVKLIAYSKHNCADTITKTVVVHPNAKANFSMTRSDSCGPLRVQFTNTSTPGNALGINVMNFRWDFGNGITSTVRDTSIVYTESLIRDTVYNVQLVAFSNYGCPDTIRKQVIVYARPKAQFTMPDTAGCAPATVLFNNTSFSRDTNNINTMSFLWDFGNGQTSTQIHPVITFSGAKVLDTVYTIKLIAFSSHGCSDTTKKTFRVFSNPKDSFTCASAGCSPFSVTFNNFSTNAVKSYWMFGDGGTDSTFNPTHQFSGRHLYDTTFTVRMVSRSANGCLGDTVSRVVTVKANPQADFSAASLSGCTPAPIQFLNNSLSAVSANWNFGDGGTSTLFNPVHTFVNNGITDTSYNVRLIVTSILGCIDTLIKPVTISPRPKADFAVNRLDSCGPFSVVFTNTSIHGNGLPISAMTFKWDFGNGVTSTTRDNIITFAPINGNDINYTVKLIAYNNIGCSDTIIKTITVHPKSKSDFVMSRTDSCGPFNVRFTNISVNGNGLPIDSMKFKWDFGNGVVSSAKDTAVSFVASLTKDSIYNVKLISYSNFGCTDTMIKQVRVYPKPKSIFVMSDTTICSSGPVSFTNHSIPNDTGTINNMSFLWDFGNGRTSLNRNETVSFVSSKIQDTIYAIKLIAYSEHGCSDTSIQYLKVYAKPLDSFSFIPATGCYNFPVSFVNTTLNGHTYYWDFGDGTTDTAKNTTHIYQNNTYGSVFYYPRLIATSINGCVGDTFIGRVEVKPRPFSDFGSAPDSGCSPLRVQFLNTSIGATSYTWDFGDGSATTNQINPSHYFYNDSVYTVTLISVSQWGCPDTVRKTVRVKTAPVAGATVASTAGCNPYTVTFNNTSTGAVRYEWYFGDGFMDTATTPTHTYINNFNTPYVFNLILIAYNGFGCSDSVHVAITVNPKPIANFVYNQPVICGNSDFQFTNSSVSGNTYLWRFGDGSTDTAMNPLHTFVSNRNKDTTYNVTMIVTSANGCKDSITRQVLVPVLVQPGFSATPLKGCAPFRVDFTDTSRNSITVIWYFGDGQASSLRNPSHVYANAGFYTVTQVAMGANGCLDSVKYANLIEVLEAPVADFNSNPIQQALPAATVNFTNTSIYKIVPTFRWDFGDGTGSTLKDPSHTYTDTGTYYVKLFVSNGFCADSVVKFIKITPAIPVASFTVDNASGCLPLAVNFQNNSTNALSYLWEFGDGNVSSLANPTHVYQNAGTYTVRLKAFGISGDDDTIMINFIKVLDKPVANFAGGPLLNYIPKADVSFINLSTKAVSFMWIFTNSNDGVVFVDTAMNPKVKFTKEGIYTVKLIAYSADGCPDSLTYVDYIKVIAGGMVYVPNVFSPNNDKLNDTFKPDGYGMIANGYELLIYDRWGNKLFQSNDPDIGWDGTYNSLKCQEDTYVWILQGHFIDGNNIRKKGTVMLIR